MKKGIKKFFLVALPLSMMAMNITSVFADDEFPVDDLENYLEVQSGGEAKRNENKEIISTFDENNIIQTRGWGESCYPTVPTYKQENGYYCGPASLQMTLKHITGTKYSQSSLASSAGTASSIGTYVYKMRDVLNSRQSKYKYAYTTVSSQSDLQKKVTASIAKEAPVIFHAKTGSLQMYNGTNLGHYVVGHTIFDPTYDPGVKVSYNDPYYKDYGKGSVYGNHTDKLSNFYLALTKWGKRYLIYSA